MRGLCSTLKSFPNGSSQEKTLRPEMLEPPCHGYVGRTTVEAVFVLTEEELQNIAWLYMLAAVASVLTCRQFTEVGSQNS